MRFNLKTIFALLTIACLSALVYQQQQKLDLLNELKTELHQELNSISPNLESHLPYLRIAAAPNKEFEALYLQATSSGDAANEKFRNEALETPDQISVSHLPLVDRTHKTFSIYVPESKVVSLQVFVSSDLFKGDIESAKTDSPFKLNKNVNVQLPSGFSTVTLQPDVLVEDQWNFILNGATVCNANSKESGLSGKSMIWLMSTHTNGIGNFRHYNISGRARHVSQADEVKLEFASFVSSDYMEAVIQGNQPTVSKLKCALVVGTDKDSGQ